MLTNEELRKQQELAEYLLKNKLLSSVNFLNYTNLTYEDIISSINSKLSSDSRFDNLRETAIVQMLLEIFAGSTDLVNYFIERMGEECFFDTAKLKSSLILLSRGLAYDIQRPIPAQCRIKIKLKGNFDSGIFSVGDVVQIPQYTNFTFEGNNFLLMKQFNYTLASTDLDRGDDYVKEIYYNETNSEEDANIRLLQGSRKVIKISGSVNPKVNQIFQKYRVSDTSFSNLYGDKDLTSKLTEIGIGSTENDAFPDGISEWEIDRKTLLKINEIEKYDFTSEVNSPKKICLIRTSIDQGVEFLFGDDKLASKGLKSVNENLFVKYLSTLGSAANKTGVIGKTGDILTSISLRTVDITDKFEFELISNISMGSDIESNDSIRVNAPSIFYTLDRLVSKKDYVNYLESLSSPIYVKNAIAWGEQEELLFGRLYNDENRTAIKKLFNVVLFSVIGSLYNTSSNLTNFSVKENLSLENAVLDSDYKDNELSSQSYFNILTVDNDEGGSIIDEVKNQLVVSQGSNETNTYNIITCNRISINTSFYEYKNYRLEQPFTVYYTSAANINTYDSDGVLSASFTLPISSMRSFQEIANWITLEIRRADIIPDDFTCVWDENKRRFVIKHKIIESQNYIVDIKDYNPNSNYALGTDRDISGIYDKITFTEGNISYSENITEVIKLLNERSQLTIKNVYISPIVQNFNLNGTVYVTNLVDKDLMKTKIYNKIYSWLDERNDFNIEIYKSNIIELIESFNTVSRVDVKIEPENTSRSDGKFNFVSGLNSRFNVDYNLDQDSKNRSVYWRAESSDYGPTNAYKISKIMQEEVNNFVNNYLSNEQYFYSTSDVNYIWGIEVVNDNKNFNNKINERFFYSKLAKPIFERIKNEISGNFSNSNIPYHQTALFLQDMSNIRKDLLYIIRKNMLDGEGNIAKEYKKVVVSNKELRQLVRGGYSLGNEIVKLKLNFQVIYK